jgi:hypothetical protein
MKQYGANKATEFTKKQISCLYGAAKRNEIKVEKWVMSELYDLADYYGYDDNGYVEKAEAEIMNIINAYFAKDMEKVQELIDNYTEKSFNAMGTKAQAKADRRMVA